MASRPTSLITILSSDHGRMRREQRDIEKIDLQRAKRYGTSERTYKERWKFVFDGVIFITDSTQTCEITSFPAPLASAPDDILETDKHNRAMQLHRLKAALSKSHTVFVIDNSGSMLEKDIPLYRDRQQAAYEMTALEFVAEQLLNDTSNNKDLVSLVEFGETATTVFEQEPVSWVLYNKLLERRDPRNFQSRQFAKLQETIRYDSNYLPALEKAADLLSKRDHEDLTLCLFFLSDGGPSDARQLKLTPAGAVKRMCHKVEELSSRYGKRLVINFVGFGSAASDFSAMKKMEEAANSIQGGAKASYFYCAKMAKSIGDAATSMVTSLTETRLAISAGVQGSTLTPRASLSSEKESGTKDEWHYHKILNHAVYNHTKNCWVHHPGLPPGALRSGDEDAYSLPKRKPPYLAINRHHCGTGVERVAYRAYLAQRPGEFVLGAMVAKETLSVERMDENIDFHRGFLETQSLAATLAEEFNKRIKGIPLCGRPPAIIFLPCSVLVVEDPEWGSGGRGVLVEKMVDETKWTKWNNNAGAVDGKVQHVPLNLDKEFAKLKLDLPGTMGAIVEGDSDEESDESGGVEESVEEENEPDFVGGSDMRTYDPGPSHYLQAFSHFTYLYTNKKVLVCDLQGVYNADAKPVPTFELTDPAIHYRSKKRRMVFGRTDNGEKGQRKFFETHKCNRVCKYLALSAKNKHWQRQWRDAGLFGLD